MKKLAYIFIFFISTSLNAQYNIDLEENIVPNPSFETYSGIPIGWFYNGKHFTSLMQYWDAATTASPDVFGRNINVPEYWKKHGFGDIKPYHGECMVGITAYGCTDGKPHCREYIQVRLIEPMVKGQKYLVEFESAHLPKSYQINN